MVARVLACGGSVSAVAGACRCMCRQRGAQGQREYSRTRCEGEAAVAVADKIRPFKGRPDAALKVPHPRVYRPKAHGPCVPAGRRPVQRPQAPGRLDSTSVMQVAMLVAERLLPIASSTELAEKNRDACYAL